MDASGRDEINAEMLPVWDIPVPERDEVRSWARNGSLRVPWQRWLFWKSELGLPDDLDTIELGCGYGKTSLLFGLSGARTTLFDYNERALQAAAGAHAHLGLHPELRQGDLLDLPEDLHGRFDVACSFGTLEHFFGANRAAVVAATASVLRPGGVFFVTVPNRLAIWYRIGFGIPYRLGLMADGMREKPYSAGELTRLAEAAGIEVLEAQSVNTFWGDFDHWIGDNARSLSRKLTGWPAQRRPPRPVEEEADPRCVHELPPRSWIDRRCSYSLLVIGRKRGASS